MKYKIGKERIYNKIYENVSDVIHWEVMPIKSEQNLYLKIISTNSKYKQGIRLAIDVGDGYIETNGMRTKEMYLWEDTAPKEVHIRCISKEGLLSIYNVFDMGVGRGGRRSQTDSCGMLVESKNNSTIFRCNDVGFNGEFDKLVFEIKKL